MSHAISWFEIPVTKMDRAATFYSTIIGAQIQLTDFGTPYAFFPVGDNEIGGALVESKEYVPSDQGSILYLSVGDDLSGALARVETAGGTILVPKTAIGDGMGFFALFLDTEGNKLGLHSPH